jgi:phage/plasmid-associated DNA primase
LAREIADAETPGIIAGFIRGASRLIRNGRYTIPPSSSAAVDDWRSAVSDVATFIKERTRPCAPDQQGTRSSVLHAVYGDWARSRKRRPCALNKFGEHMTAAGHIPHHTDLGNYYSVELLDDAEEREAIQGEGTP